MHPTFRIVIKTGGKLVALERVLRGGIPTGSLTLLEGARRERAKACSASTYFFMAPILDGLGAAYFSAQHTAGSLAKQMRVYRPECLAEANP